MKQDETRISAWLQVLERKVNTEGNNLLRNTDITVMQLRVLKYLQSHPEESQIADLSEFFDVTHTSMVHVVNSLEDKGYVSRQPIRRSRGKNIVLSETGRKLAEENEGRIQQLEDEMTEGFTETEKEELVKMLKKINDNLARHADKKGD